MGTGACGISGCWHKSACWRAAVWYGFAPVALCTAWDANAQETVKHGLFAAALLLGGAYLALCWYTRHRVHAQGELTPEPVNAKP